MGGNKAGGKKAAATNRAKYGEDFYSRIGGMNVKSWIANGRKPRGFSVNRELARQVGAWGGKKSKRGKKVA